MGSLPIAFTLKLFPNGFSRQEKAVMWCTMTVSTVLSVVGTVWAFLPKSIIGAKPGPAMDSL